MNFSMRFTGVLVVFALLATVVGNGLFAQDKQPPARWQDIIIEKEHPNYWKFYGFQKTPEGVIIPASIYGKPRTTEERVAGADAVVLGVVKAIEVHSEGPYHVWIRIAVDKCFKGCVGEQEIIVKREAGDGAQRQAPIIIFDHYAKMLEGERVLMFLTTVPYGLWSHGETLLNRERWAREAGQNRFSDEGCRKFLKGDGENPFKNVHRTEKGCYEEMEQYNIAKDKAVLKSQLPVKEIKNLAQLIGEIEDAAKKEKAQN